MIGAPELIGLRGLYGRSSAERIGELVESVDALAAGLQTLRTTPTRDGAERIEFMASDIHRLASQLAGVLAAELSA